MAMQAGGSGLLATLAAGGRRGTSGRTDLKDSAMQAGGTGLILATLAAGGRSRPGMG